MGTSVVVLVAVLVLALVVVAGTRMLRTGAGRRSGMHNALGNFIDVFDPSRSRAEEDLKSQRHSGPVTPTPDDEEPPVVVDLDTGRARVRRPRTPE
jgi:hypothetical protein